MSTPRTLLVLCACVSMSLTGCTRKDSAPTARTDASIAASSVVPSASTSLVDVVSSASTSWDAGPTARVVTSGAVDGEALRSRNRARIKADRSAVTMLQGGSPRELGERLCKAVVPQRPKDTPILIKPNLGGFEWFKDPARNGGDDGLRGRITDPEFVRGIIACLKARGHDRITIAEGWGATHKDWEHLIAASGYAAMARDEHVKLVAMDDDGVFDVEGDQPGKPLAVHGMEKTHAPTLLMAKVLAEHLERGLFISAPKVKAHRFGVTSMSIKGGQGVVMLSDASPAFHQKWRMHKRRSATPSSCSRRTRRRGRRRISTASTCSPSAWPTCSRSRARTSSSPKGHRGWAATASESAGPHSRTWRSAGRNPILVDRVGAAFLGLWDNADLARELGGHRTSPLIEVAAKRFGVDVSAPLVEGDGAGLLAAKRPVHFVSMSGFTIHSDASPAGAGADAGADAGESEARPVIRAKHIEDAALAIDGVREAAWDAVTPVAFDTDWSGAPTKATTRVRTAWSKGALYMLWEASRAQGSPSTSSAR